MRTRRNTTSLRLQITQYAYTQEYHLVTTFTIKQIFSRKPQVNSSKITLKVIVIDALKDPNLINYNTTTTCCTSGGGKKECDSMIIYKLLYSTYTQSEYKRKRNLQTFYKYRCYILILVCNASAADMFPCLQRFA